MKRLKDDFFLFVPLFVWWILLFALLALSGCKTERQTQNVVNKALANQDAFNTLGMYWQGLHPCINDTTIKTVTQYIQGTPKTVHDTTVIDGTVYIHDKVTVHDTAFIDRNHYIEDKRALNQSLDSIAKYKAKSAQLWADSITNAGLYQSNLKAEKNATNKWKWRSYKLIAGLALVGGFLLFKKPILTFITGGWSKIFKLLK